MREVKKATQTQEVLYRQYGEKLPPEISNRLIEYSKSGSKEKANAYVCRLVDEGKWAYSAIAEAVGLTREAIRQRCARCAEDNHEGHNLISDVEVKDRAKVKIISKTTRAVVPVEYAEELKSLRAVATTNRGDTPENHPTRVAAREYAKRVYEVWSEGYTAYSIAKSVGVSTGAINRILIAYGYKPTTGKSKAMQLAKYVETIY